MERPWWLIVAAVALLSILGTAAFGLWAGAQPQIGQYAGMETAYEGITCAMLAAIADGLAVFVAIGMAKTFGQRSGRSLAPWLFGAAAGFVVGMLALASLFSCFT